jgi:hypothetical protein
MHLFFKGVNWYIPEIIKMLPNIIPILFALLDITRLFIGTDHANSNPTPVSAQITRYIPTKNVTLSLENFDSSASTDDIDCSLVRSLL